MNLEKYNVIYSLLLDEYFKKRRGQLEIITVDGEECLNSGIISKELKQKLWVITEIKYRHCEGLNIFERQGVKVSYNPKSVSYITKCQENAKEYLQEGKVYTIKATLAASSYTLVEIEEIPGVIFNSVSFFNYEKESKELEQLLKEYGADLEQDVKKAEEILQKIGSGPVLTEVD